MTVSERSLSVALPCSPGQQARPRPVPAVRPRVPTGAYARYGKRALSLSLSLLALPFALALALPIALANLLQFRRPERILFAQPRVGRAGRMFTIWKFRTMREVAAEDFDSWCEGRDRLRVTALGRLLRNTHLDELPQLWNVLRGDMDLVGPRPEMLEIHAWASEEVPGFARRLAVRPGLTGLAQVTQGYAGMDVDAYRAKLAADLAYLRTQTLAGDLRLLARTVLWMLEGKGWIPRAERQPVRLLGGNRSAVCADAAAGPPRPATIHPWPRSDSSTTRASRNTTPAPVTSSVRSD